MRAEEKRFRVSHNSAPEQTDGALVGALLSSSTATLTRPSLREKKNRCDCWCANGVRQCHGRRSQIAEGYEADLSLLLIFAGVIGGLLAFGLIGIFVGPVVLAVADTLLNAWIDAGPNAENASESQAPTGE